MVCEDYTDPWQIEDDLPRPLSGYLEGVPYCLAKGEYGEAAKADVEDNHGVSFRCQTGWCDDVGTIAVCSYSWAQREYMSSHCFCCIYEVFSRVDITDCKGTPYGGLRGPLYISLGLRFLC